MLSNFEFVHESLGDFELSSELNVRWLGSGRFLVSYRSGWKVSERTFVLDVEKKKIFRICRKGKDGTIIDKQFELVFGYEENLLVIYQNEMFRLSLGEELDQSISRAS